MSTKNNEAPNQSERPLKNRNSFHQDVNEALNSLLWQPYEYQNNKQMSEDSSSSLSSFSSCCSLSSIDLERGPNNGSAQSERCGNTADLHLTVEMVNNLTGYGNQLNQSHEGIVSRELLTPNVPSRLLTDVSTNECRARCTSSSVACIAYNNNNSSGFFVDCNEFRTSADNMRVEISTHPVTPTSSTAVTTSTALNRTTDAEATARTPINSVVVNLTHQNAAGGDGAAKSTAAMQQRHSYISPPPISSPAKHGYQRSISSDMIPSNINSIVSANVVGLPNHPRHASVPSTTTQNRNSTGNGFIFPNHPRNSSEPSAVIQQPVVVNHSRNGSTPSNVMAATSNATRNVSTSMNVITTNSVRNVTAPMPSVVTTCNNSVRTVSAPSNVTINQGVGASSSMTVPDRNISCANIVSILSHHRHSSHVTSTDVLPNFAANSLRSASVPKAMSINSGENNTTTTTLNVPNNQRNYNDSQQNNKIPVNVSSVDVSFYRAVPVTVVSNVPTIQCMNNSIEPENNISNVNIVQAMPPTSAAVINNQPISTPQINTSFVQTSITTLPPSRILQVPLQQSGGIIGTTQVTVHTSPAEESQSIVPQRNQEEVRTRTFTSTEAQTDDTTVGSALIRNGERALSREQRRRERRERRHLRRINNASHQHGGLQGTTRGNLWNGNNHNDRLPDLLSNHMPPPYSPNHANFNNVSTNSTVVPGNLVHNSLVPGTIVPNNVVPSGVVASHVVPFHQPVVAGQVPLVQGGASVAVPVPTPSGFRFPFPTAGFRR
ncbi:hypothetical protein ILUMI_03550 [Ignelater luminosus]|uniref:Uncharacterized protein n=1 Tax=Ignelater luminosus TaxID=2038154 RepID=A0A8K0DLJ9_IGNLU|nr:hypothetical protein ILUMI_03550 [Ignelater luminosus]